MEKFLRVQVGYYEDMIKQELQALITCLEEEAEEYAMQLGLDEKRKSLRARAKARREILANKAEPPVPGSKHIINTDSGHEIHKDQPQLVLD